MVNVPDFLSDIKAAALYSAGWPMSGASTKPTTALMPVTEAARLFSVSMLSFIKLGLRSRSSGG